LGKWLVGVSITGAFSELVIRFMIISLLGLSAQGRFTASFSLPNFANPVVITYTNYLRITMASRFATGGKRSVFLLLFRSVPVFLMISIGLFGAIAFFGEWAAAAVFGMQFADLGHLIAWNCLSALVSAMTLPLEAALLTLGRGKDLFLSSVGRIGCTLCLGIPLIYGFELPGASILAAIGFLAVAIIQSVYLLRQFTTVQSTHSDDVEAEPIQ
jgi:O-antigen/teichoic acid export membrane protein